MSHAIANLATELAFSRDEYQERCRRLRALMPDAGVDVMLVHQPPSVFYFSGYENLHVYDNECVVVPQDGPVSLLVPHGDLTRAQLTSWVEPALTFSPGDEPATILAQRLTEQGLGRARIGVEKRVARAAGLSIHTFDALRAALPQATFVDASGLPERVKLVKSPQEIAHLRTAATYTDAGIRAALAAAAEGRTDNDVAAAAYDAMVRAGSEFFSIPAIVNAGPYTGVSHSTHRRHRLDRGDMLFLELGGCHRRYSAPCMRTAVIAMATDEARRLADGCLAALESMHAMMRPGVSFHAVTDAAARGIAGSGVRADWGGDCGYPVGAGFPPHWGDYTCRIRPGTEMALAPGMVFHQPIALRVPGRIGVAFSETVLITDTGCETLTRTERRLVVC